MSFSITFFLRKKKKKSQNLSHLASPFSSPTPLTLLFTTPRLSLFHSLSQGQKPKAQTQRLQDLVFSNNLIGSIFEKGISDNPPPPKLSVLPYLVTRHYSHDLIISPFSSLLLTLCIHSMSCHLKFCFREKNNDN